MKENNKKLAWEWFEKANDDEKAIENLLKEGGPFSIVCFLAQQLAEKYLKGYLVFNGKRFQKIHDLKKILEKCQRIDEDFKEFINNCVFLNRYYIGTRYPGNFLEGISEKEARDAYQKAKEIKEFILERLF